MKPANRNDVQISSGKATINGNLEIPSEAKSIVLFAHGSGSSRFSPRNTYVARLLNREKIATLLIDLLTMEEESLDEYTGQFRFNIDLLAERLVDSTNWIMKSSEAPKFTIGYFGASTGAAAALIAAARLSNDVKAIVSRGGRPDLAEDYLPKVKAPTLLIVGGDDQEVLELNKQAFAQLHSEKKIEVIPGATHLFEEPGKLKTVAELAIDWFNRYL